MKNEDKQVILNVSKELHTLVETSYLNNKAVKADDDWLENNDFFSQIWHFIYCKHQ